MKYVLIGLLLCLSVVAMAQNAPTSLRKRISDDEKTLSIQIDGMQHGKPVHIDQSFDVAGMNQLQKEWLTLQTFQSQNVPVSVTEVPWLILLVLGVLSLVITLLIIIYQTQRASQLSAVKGF
ncbi:hypothetical protein [uncultured Fibrella sp.]|uniref:hypothetical protein n=1 Tax=uncultured Fibrella sp. TaxID=1284596 RepID=UPI0035CAFBD5